MTTRKAAAANGLTGAELLHPEICEWPRSFTPADIAMFTRFRVPPGLVRDAGVERVTDHEVRTRHGIYSSWAPRADLSGLLFLYSIPRSEYLVAFKRLRLDNPIIDRGRPVKYLSPAGVRKHLYYPPNAKEKLADPKTKIVLVEAEKSVLAMEAWARRMDRDDLLTLGLGGCWGWMGRSVRHYLALNGTRVDLPGPLPDLYDLHGRTVFVLLDSNCATNPDVQAARTALVLELNKHHCAIRICELPGD